MNEKKIPKQKLWKNDSRGGGLAKAEGGGVEYTKTLSKNNNKKNLVTHIT